MSKCQICDNEMGEENGCIEHSIALISGETVQSVKHTSEHSLDDPNGERCPDCGTPPGEYHHSNCDWARMDDSSQLLFHTFAHWNPDNEVNPYSAKSDFIFVITEKIESSNGNTRKVLNWAYQSYENAVDRKKP